MPKLQPYEQQTRAPRPNAQTLDFGGAETSAALGRAFEGMADDHARLQAFARQKEEERAAVWANEQVMNVRSRWVEELPKRQQSASETAEGFTLQTLTDFDTQADEIIKTAPTQASRAWMKDRLGQVRLGLQQDALGFEARRGVEFKVNGLTRSVDQARTAAEFRPDEFATIAAEQAAAIEASGLPADAKAKLTQDSLTSIASASVEGMIRRDPYSALKELNDEQSMTQSVRALPFERRQVLRNAAEAEINRRESEKKANLVEFRQALTDQLNDIRAAASAGMTITDIPSRAALVTAFGEQEGEQRYKQSIAMANLAPKVSALYQAPVSDIVATVDSFKPTQVEGAADQLAMLGIVQQKAASILREREADVGGYLATHSPTVKAAWDGFQRAEGDESEAAAQEYLRSVRAEKERLGIQSADVLPETYADALVSRLTKPQAAEQLSVAMQSEAARWGSAWPQVYRQVSKKLPDAALVIGSGIPKRAADTLALMSSKTETELKTLIPARHSLNDIQKDVTDDLSDLVATFGPEGATVLTAVHSSAVKTAIGYMAGGSSYRDAITQAANDIANDRYSFQHFRDQSYRVPVGIDADAVDGGATYFLERYLQPSGTVQVPDGTPEETILSQASEHIRRTGYWRTSPDESGLRLYVGTGVVPGVGGKPVQLTWQQLEDLSRQDAAERAQRSQAEAARRGERSQQPGLR